MTTTTSALRVLAIDDDPQDAELLARNLELVNEFDITFSHAAEAVQVASELKRADVDVVFLDYQLGSENGIDVLGRIRSTGYLGPVIALTGHGDQYLATELIRAGADDYIAKADLDPERLRMAIRHGAAQYAQRQVSAQNSELVSQLTDAKRTLEDRNQRLSELYRTAHQFVDDVSHEFRTPLTVVKDFASILRDGIAGEVNEKQTEYLDIIINRVDDLVTMVGDMLDISKIEAGKLGVSRRAQSIDEVIERVRSSLERRAEFAGVDLAIDVPAGLPDTYCDPEKAGRVIINLVINAIKFSDKDEGEVGVTVRHVAGADEITVAVSDNGPGIPEDNLERIFQRFRQVDGNLKANIKGFGLGLGISKQLVQLNLGQMTVESVEGEGSTFSFSLPVSEPAPLMARFLRMTDAMREGGATFVSLVSAVAPDVDGATSSLISAFLQSETRHTDLLFGSEGRWLITVAMADRDARMITERLHGAREHWNANNPGETLPRIRFRSLGTWRIGERNDDLVRCFKTLWNGREVSRAVTGATSGPEDPSLRD